MQRLAPHPLNIWCNATLSPEAVEILRLNVAAHKLTVTQVQSDPIDPQTDVVFGQPDPKQLMATLTVKWIHLDSGGYTRYDTPEFRAWVKARGVLVTNSSSIFAAPCAEHVLAMMLSLARQLPQAMRQQLGDRPWKTPALRAGCNILDSQTAIIFGFGAIGRRLAELLQPLHMKVIGVRRNSTGAEGIRMVTPAEADSLLAQGDHVIDSLPENAETRSYFNAARFKAMKRGAIFYNIGRGGTVDQSDLMQALTTARLAAAYLDVMTPEPLPPTHPLWDTPNCYITPHIGGVHARQYERLASHFLSNLLRFSEEKAVLDRIL